ncbi:MAG: TIGR02996 domain-containing protein [Myxococcaceae bacterium]
MPENDDLLRLCLEKPADLERLLVYADWLEEHGDPRAPYTRAQLEYRRASEDDQLLALPKLRSLYPLEHGTWCGRFEQAGVFAANLLEVRDMWWGVGLGERATSSTYQGFEYARQPPLPLDRLDGTFAWLAASPERTSFIDEEDDTQWAPRLASLKQRGFNVPTAFERLMLDADLQRRVPSCTDNTFLSGKRAEEHPQPDGGLFVTFYTDSQSCVLWGLRLGKGSDRYAAVLAGAPEYPDTDPPEGEPYFRFPDLTFNAPTFETFVYRWWLENSIWFALNGFGGGKRALTPDEQTYLARLRAA